MRDDRPADPRDTADSIREATLRAYPNGADNPNGDDLDALLVDIQREYPALSRHAFAIRRGLASNDPRLLEFYPPWESQNPAPGRHTVEILNNELRGPVLKDLVAADMLHALGAVDPTTGEPVDPAWRAMKGLFKESLTLPQQALERSVYNDQVKRGREHRPFDEYLDDVRLDAYLRAGMFPRVNPAWGKPGTFTEEQQALFDRMREHLKNPKSPDIKAGANATLRGLEGAPYYGRGAEVDSDVVGDTERRGDRQSIFDTISPSVGRGWPRPFERRTPGEERMEQEGPATQQKMDEADFDNPQIAARPSVAPTAAALALLGGTA